MLHEFERGLEVSVMTEEKREKKTNILTFFMDYTWYKKYLLPGFIAQSVLIAGGYGTGRELVEYFVQYGPTVTFPGFDGHRKSPENEGENRGGCFRWRKSGNANTMRNSRKKF